MAFSKLSGSSLEEAKLLHKPMQKIAPFGAGGLPATLMNQFTQDLNELIITYNQALVDTKRKEILKNIQTKTQEINYKFPQKLLALSPGYHEASAFLFKQIKEQYASMEITSLLADLQKSSPLSEVIANMSPEKADALALILIKDSTANLNAELASLYSVSDINTEAVAFHAFLNTHEIKFLGGGNSKNFEVTHLMANTKEVLKIDNRMSMPKSIEAHLRSKHSELFIPNRVERQVMCEDPTTKAPVNRTLVVTEYCSGGSVLDHRVRQKSVTQLAEDTGLLFEQMARALLDIQNANCLFPDAKISNWLVDEQNQIRIGDTKSFLFTDTQHEFVSGLPENKYCGFLASPGYKPPEFKGGDVLYADKVHAYILGINLYIYTAGTKNIGDNGANFDFNKPLFRNSSCGPQYQKLIAELVKPHPAGRMSIQEALNQLIIIKHPKLENAITELKTLKFGQHDQQMSQFINKTLEQYSKANESEREHIFTKLQTTITSLKADKATTEIREIIHDFRERAGIFTRGMNAKANRIEQAMANMPLEERCHFFSAEKSKEVLAALASHRSLGKSGTVYKDKKENIDGTKAAQSFKNFKRLFQEEMEQAEKKDIPHEKAPPNSLNTL